MKLTRYLSGLLLLAGLALNPAWSQPSAALPKGMSQALQVEGITEYRLANGLQVLLVPDDAKPSTTVNLTFRVGSRHENYGETGMAHLLDRSIPFNRFVVNQLNERLGQFIAAREIDRQNHPDARVARNLAALFHPVLYPGVGQWLRITQQELGYLVGLSRQRVNQALSALQHAELIRIEYGGVRVLDLDRLRRYAPPET